MYSTCTLNPEENEHNVRHFLDNFPVHLVALPQQLGRPGHSGQAAVLSAAEASLVQRFPSEEWDTVAFFIAKFQKCCQTGLQGGVE